ncbi:MAG: NAD(P)-dependent oxidoreductase, partial [Vagococcus sp.]
TRKIKEAILQQEQKNWLKPEGLSDLNGKKVMIVGTGHIGERLAEILQVFQTEVTGVNRKGREVPHFDHIVRQENIQTVIGDMDIIISLLPDSM